MSLKHLVLGLLKYAPMSGYDLNKAFQASVQHFWHTDQSLIYRALYSMTDVGWVAYDQKIQDHLPNKKLYRLTETGLAEFRRWLATPQSTLSFHEGWLGQLFFGAELSTDQLRLLLKARIAMLRETLDIYENQVPHSASAYADAFDVPQDMQYWLMTLDYGRHRLHSDLQWLEAALQRFEDIAGETKKNDQQGS